MTLPNLRDLTAQTLTDPSAAARALIALRLPQGMLWQALVLMAVLQAMVYALSDLAVPGPPPLALLLGSPLQFFGIAMLGLILFVHAVHLFGRFLGGSGSLDDLLVVMVWLQCLRAAVQLIMLILSLTVPILAILLMFAATLFGIYITLHFVNQALQLDSLAKALFAFLGAVLMIAVGMSILLALVGAPIPGATGNV